MDDPVPIYELMAIANAWFSELPTSVRGEVLRRVRNRSLLPRQRLYSRGDPQDGFFCVKTGAVRVSGLARDGREIVLDFYGHGVWFGETSMLDGLKRSHNAQAHGPATVWHLPQTDFEEMVAGCPPFARGMLRLEGLRQRLLLTALESYSSDSLERRLANRLLLLAVSHAAPSDDGLKFGLRLSHEVLAQLIGSTRQRVNQILKGWVAEGVIHHHYGDIVITDERALKAMTTA
jgi:CRP-like cAMP-binding protein